MNAIKMLKLQHREIDKLFKEFASAKSGAAQMVIFDRIADALALHAAIEERHFYPEVKANQTEEILFEAVEEHLEIKRSIADIMTLQEVDETFEAKVKVLKEDVEHHVGQEESELFPKVEKLIDEETLEMMGARMEETQAELLSEGNPRDSVPDEVVAAAPI
jgi:hemerythrin superfamily protein